MSSSSALEKLIFDPADANGESQNMGAYVRAGDDGTLIGHVADALKVSIANASIAITATNLDIRDLVFSTDKVDVSGSVVALDAPTLAALESITAVLDISSLVADDAVDSENPLKVGSRAVSGLLSAISASGDKANMISDMYRRVQMVKAPNVGVAHSVLAVSDVEAAFPTVAGQTQVILQNDGTKPIWIGSTGVTATGATRGIKIKAGDVYHIEMSAGIPLFAVAATGITTEVVFINMG